MALKASGGNKTEPVCLDLWGATEWVLCESPSHWYGHLLGVFRIPSKEGSVQFSLSSIFEATEALKLGPVSCDENFAVLIPAFPPKHSNRDLGHATPSQRASHASSIFKSASFRSASHTGRAFLCVFFRWRRMKAKLHYFFWKMKRGSDSHLWRGPKRCSFTMMWASYDGNGSTKALLSSLRFGDGREGWISNSSCPTCVRAT